MEIPRFHPREAERLCELDQVRILDTAETPEFMAVVRHIQALFDVPIALVSIADRDRLWFKAQIGLSHRELPRDGTFCNRTIYGTEVVVIEDLTTDPEFANSPFVVDAGLRFYAGVPLALTAGLAIGTLCVMGYEPRPVTEAERGALTDLGIVLSGLIRGHRLAQDAVDLALQADAQRFVVEEQRRELEIRERRFRQTETMAQVGGWEAGLVNGGAVWSDEMYRIFEIPIGTPVTLDTMLECLAEDDRFRVETVIEAGLLTLDGFDEEFRIVTRAGREKWVRCIGDVEVLDGEARRFFGSLQDISAQRQAEKKLWYTANTDALTGLANRTRFETALDEAFGSGETPRSALLMLDVDHLKEVNDTLGHNAGDRLMCTVAERLSATVGDSALVARLGGDEFAVLLPGIDEGAAMAVVAERILAAMKPSFTYAGQTITPKVSIGGAIADPATAPVNLRQAADIALYHAKEQRRGLFVAFREDLRTAITRRVHVLQTVEAALADDRITTWYQPIVDLSTGRIAGVESLARLRMPDGTVRTAGEFASAFDDPRLASQLTERALAAIAADLKIWTALGMSLPHVGINVGMHDFRAGGLSDRILAFCDRAAQPPSHFMLEVTEHVFLSRSADAVTRTVETLRDHGMTVALDDFGTGYASLAHLGTFPVDIIKMDRSFVARMMEDGPGPIISSTLVHLAHRLGIAVIAEGIETGEQVLKLGDLDCEMGQGFFFARPMPARDLLALLKANQPFPRRSRERLDRQVSAR